MSTADKLNKILETKEAIKQAIIDKGVEIGDWDVFAEYPNAIRQIETGGSGEGGGNDLATEYFNLKTYNGTDFAYLFYGCGRETLDLSDWDTSSVYNMYGAFNNCNIRELNVSGWDTSNVTDMSCMFSNCWNLIELDLSNFNTGNANSMESMFEYSSNLQKLDIRNFSADSVRMRGFISGCSNLRELRLDNCDYNTIESILTTGDYPINAIEGETRKIYVNPNNVGKLIAPDEWVFVNKDTEEIILPEFTVYTPYEYRDSDNKSNMTKVYTIVNDTHTDLSYMFQDCSNLKTIPGIENWDTSNVTTMGRMFINCLNLIELNLSGFNTSKVTDIGWMFFNCSNLEVLDIRNFDMSSINTGDPDCSNCIFSSCYRLRELRLDNCSNDTIRTLINSTEFPTGDVEVNWEWQKRKMYVNPDNIGELTAPEGWEFVYVNDSEPGDEEQPEQPGEIPLYVPKEFMQNGEITEVTTMVTAEHTDLSEMFQGCRNLTTINGIDQWDTSNVTNMSYMFLMCGITELDLSSFNTSQVTDMNNMFKRSNIVTLDLSNFDMANVTNTDAMFEESDVRILRLDNCSYDTINKIITSHGFPDYSPYNPETGENDIIRLMYVQEANVSGLTAPNSWEFVYVN